MNKNLDNNLESIKNLSEKDKMTIASVIIADVLIKRGTMNIESSATFGDPDEGYETIVKVNAELIVNEL